MGKIATPKTRKLVMQTTAVTAVLLYSLCSIDAKAGFEWLPTGKTPYTDTPKLNVVPPTSPQPEYNNAPPQTTTQNIFLPMPGQTNQAPPPTQAVPADTTTNTAKPAMQTYKPSYRPPSQGMARMTDSMAQDNIKNNVQRLRQMAESQTSYKKTSQSHTQSTQPIASQNVAAARPYVDTENSSFEIVSGFGSDMPLALALRQVVPPSYAFSFGPGVNPGYRVSWNGGKPWNEIIHDMIAPLNLVGFVKGNKLYINQKVTSSMADPLQPRTLPIDMSSTPDTTSSKKPLFVSSENISSGPAQDTNPRNTFVYNDPGMVNAAAELSQEVTENPIQRQPDPAPTHFDGRRENITDPGQHTRPQTAQTMARIKQIANYGYASKKTQTEKSAPKPLLPDDQNQPPQKTGRANQFWEAAQGSSLKSTLHAWSKDADVELLWQTSQDYRVESNVFVNGSFQNALRAILTEGLADGPKPSITFYETPNGPKSARLKIQDQS